MKLDYMSRLETAEGGVTYHLSLHIKGLDQARAAELQQEALRLVSLASMEEQTVSTGVRPSVAACSAARCPDLVGSREGKILSRTCKATGYGELNPLIPHSAFIRKIRSSSPSILTVISSPSAKGKRSSPATSAGIDAYRVRARSESRIILPFPSFDMISILISKVYMLIGILSIVISEILKQGGKHAAVC